MLTTSAPSSNLDSHKKRRLCVIFVCKSPKKQRQDMMMRRLVASVTLVAVFVAVAHGWQPSVPSNSNKHNPVVVDRRYVMKTAVAGVSSLFFLPSIANAGIDPSLLKSLPVEGDSSGSAQRLRQVEAIQRPASDLTNVPFEELPSGVSYREYREGKGDATVQNGSKVAVEMTIRCKSFSTANEPGGLKYFSTKDDTEFNELAWTVGSGSLPEGLEEGMMGMHKNSLRRIELPSTMVYAAKKSDQLPLPTTKDGKRRFENLFKTDATLLFEVLVTRIK